MMNPSVADRDQSDPTVNNVLEHFDDGNTRIVNILNLLPFYCTGSEELWEYMQKVKWLDEVLEENIKVISETVKESDKIVLAWGVPNDFPRDEYDNRINKVYSCMESNDNLFIFKHNSSSETMIRQDGYPYHPVNTNGKINGINQIKIKNNRIHDYRCDNWIDEENMICSLLRKENN